jgi:hypothetical protein
LGRSLVLEAAIVVTVLIWVLALYDRSRRAARVSRQRPSPRSLSARRKRNDDG